jgi:hypothetical protein
MKSILTGLPSSREVFCTAGTNTPLELSGDIEGFVVFLHYEMYNLYFGQKNQLISIRFLR